MAWDQTLCCEQKALTPVWNVRSPSLIGQTEQVRAFHEFVRNSRD